MKIIFVGTGSGRTSVDRFHSSLFITDEKTGFLIDTGDGISRALLNSKINFNSVTHILITHFHADHVAGLASLITQMKITKREHPLKIYVPAGFSVTITFFLNSCYLFEDHLGFDLEIVEVEMNTDVSVMPELNFRLRENGHVVNKYNIGEEKNVKFFSAGILFNFLDNYIYYTADMGSEKDLSLFDDYPVEMLISETTHLPVEAIQKFAVGKKIKEVYLTHIEDSDEKEIEELINSVKPNDYTKLKVAVDGLLINLSDVF